MPRDIVTLAPSQVKEFLPSLVELLIDAVDSGASIGWLPPLGVAEATAYWHTVAAAIAAGERELIVEREGGEILGAVQLFPEMRANGRHRAEAGKLFVHRRARRRGIARALLAALERAAEARGITLLLMDTRLGGEAEKLCDSLGYTRWGEVPEYARSANGDLHTTVFFYRRLVNTKVPKK
ncbi:MAG: GNAT family N-acetyltransferase [Bryobacterales bacterium]|nr:GNAT family N-acetyltransferase [Bryobacterales bacterium]